MEKLVEEYKVMLNGSALASDKFWALWERLKRDKRSPGVILEGMSRSTMRMHLFALLRHKNHHDPGFGRIQRRTAGGAELHGRKLGMEAE
ncbi:MAG: hypothetical protein K5990_02245 [Oscillospiraceae bacterium]|nr:hypothetical protein [Oscillospiraceae bacterium]